MPELRIDNAVKNERSVFPMGEIRVSENTETENKSVLRGHAAVFNSPSVNMSPFVDMEFFEYIKPGAFANVLNDDVRALFNHDANMPLARSVNKSLLMREDDTGLFVEIHPTDTTFSRDLLENIRSGVVNQMSFGFIVDEDEYEIKEDKERGVEVVKRTITKFKELFDVSPVTYPAFPSTDIGVRDKNISSKDVTYGGDVEKRSVTLNGVEYRAVESLIAEAFRCTGYRSSAEQCETNLELRNRERERISVECGV